MAQPGAPADGGVYATAAERSKAANQQFVAVAKQYGWLPRGAKAHYFAGVTYQELGQNASAETELKTAAGSWDRNLSNLAKLALAGLYHQTARDAQAIELYNALAAKPSETVPAGVAQLDLADLYVAEGKQDQSPHAVGQGEGRRQGRRGRLDCRAKARREAVRVEWQTGLAGLALRESCPFWACKDAVRFLSRF